MELDEKNIEARPVWKPMHMQTVFDYGSGLPAGRQAGFRVQGLKAGQNKKRYKASPSEIRSAVVNEFHGVKVVGGEVAEDLFSRGLCPPGIARP